MNFRTSRRGVHRVRSANAAKWGPGPSSAPTGAQLVSVVGDPTKEGSYVIRMKAPAGYKVCPHVHTNDENVTVLSGMFHIGFGDKFDESKGHVVKPGGFVLCRRAFSISRGRAWRPSFRCTVWARTVSPTLTQRSTRAKSEREAGSSLRTQTQIQNARGEEPALSCTSAEGGLGGRVALVSDERTLP